MTQQSDRTERISRISRAEIEARMRDHILVLDGAMGTMIQRLKLSSNNNMDALNLFSPDSILVIHRAYITAGAEIIETNTFSGTAVSQAEYGLGDKVYEINRRGAEIARRAADEDFAKRAGSAADEEVAKHCGRVIVAGAMGPAVKSLSLSPDVNRQEFRDISFDELSEAYAEQVRGLIDGGADVLLAESVYDGLNAKAALYAIDKVQKEKGTDLPIMVSATINDKYGRLLTGQKASSLFVELEHHNLLSFGLNCSFGAKDLMPVIEELSGFCNCAISIYPNAGLPNEMGEYEETPEYTASCIKELAAEGCLNIAGGCCGTTPGHIAAIASAIKDCKPRHLHGGDYGEGDKAGGDASGDAGGNASSDAGCGACEKYGSDIDDLYLSGLEKLLINRKKNNFINIGERTNVAGSAKFARLMRERNFKEAAEIAAKQIEDGATVIDINTDDAMANGTELMQSFLRYLGGEPEIAEVPVMIDSSNWETILSGVKNCCGKCIVNSISLKDGEEEFIRRARELYLLDAAVVVMAFDEQGQASTYEKKIEVCKRAYDILTKKVGFAPSDIVLDCNILTIATGMPEHDNYAVDFIKAVKWIKENLPGAKTSGGVSNLSFAFRGNNKVREAMHSLFLYHAIRAGLDMAIVNPSMLQVYDDIDPELLKRVEAVVLNEPEKVEEKGMTPSEWLTELATKIKNEQIATKEKGAALQEESARTPEQRVQHALIKGNAEGIEKDLAEMLKSFPSPVEIIEGPLMQAMDDVGKMFGEGKMFLPQVVKSARVMKEAVNFLQPYLGLREEHSVSQPVIVLATAKGDIHDIGKNIVSIVLSCNNFKVIDLGVTVDNQRIVDEAIKNHADLIGLSGLITPSLQQMEDLAKLLEENKWRMLKELGYLIPLGVGGATASSVHTAVKIAPLYSGTVVYGRDASQSAVIYKRLVNDSERRSGNYEAHAKSGAASGRYYEPGSYAESIKREQEKIRSSYKERNVKTVSIEEARKRAEHFDAQSFIQPKGYGGNNLFAKNLVLSDFAGYIDWTGFFNFWGFKGKFPVVAYEFPEAEKLYDKALQCLGEMMTDGSVEASLMLNFYEAQAGIANNGEIDDNACAENCDPADVIRILDLNGVQLAEIPVPRQTAEGSEYKSLADFFPAAPATSRIGLFVLKIEDKKNGELEHTDFEYLLRYSICARLAEALSVWMEKQISMGQHMIRPAFGYAVCPDHALKRTVFELLKVTDRLKISLTESNAIIPTTSICGMLIAHPEAHYFDL